MRPGKELAAKAGTEKARDHLHVFARHAERLRHHMLVVHHPLRGLIQGEFGRVPHRDRGVHLHWIVRLGRRDVGLVHLDRGRGEGRFHVAALGFGMQRQLFRLRVIQPGVHVEGCRIVGDLNGRSGSQSLLVSFGDDEGDELAPVADCGVFERRARLAGAAPVTTGSHAKERRRASTIEVVMMQHCNDSGHLQRLCGVDGADRSRGNGAGYRYGVNQTGEMVVGSVLRGAGCLKRPIDAGQVGADYGGRCI